MKVIKNESVMVPTPTALTVNQKYSHMSTKKWEESIVTEKLKNGKKPSETIAVS